MLKEYIIKLHKDSLFRNSIYLMFATVVLSGFGFLFWLISAKLISPEQVGLATTMVSVMNMISIFSLIGFDTAVVRFLVHSKDKNAQINTGVILVGLAAIVLSGIFVAGIDFISPSLDFIRDNPLYAFAFIVFCVMSSINVLTDAVFLAYRKTLFSLIINSIFSVLKVILPLFFARWGAFGIFSAMAITQSVGFILSIIAMIWKFDYRPSFTVDIEVVKNVWKYCLGNYVADIFNFLPATLLPVIITNGIGAKESAYFYVVMMIGNLLYVIPSAVTRSLFAEGSYDTFAIAKNVRTAIRTIAALLTPAILFLLFFGEYVLEIFGKNYSNGGTELLYIMAISGIFVSSYSLYGSLFRINHDLYALMIRNCTYATAIIVFSYFLLPFGLTGVGFAWISGSIISSIVSFFLYYKRHVSKRPIFTKDFFQRLYAWFYELIYPSKTALQHKYQYIQALRRNDFKKRTVLFYPEKPKTFHFLYKMCHTIGWDITSNPKDVYDLAIAFEDTTFRLKDPVLEKLGKTRKVVNLNCKDISKKHVEEVFEEVFGYGMKIDPRTHNGPCVRKSDSNALHDGKIVECPTEPEAGYIYQKLINNQFDDNTVTDLRVPIMGGEIPFVCRRYRSINDRFDNTQKYTINEPGDQFNPEEIEKVLEFCRRFGLDYGEIDALRDNDDERIYIVDVNNTPATPRPEKQIPKENYSTYMELSTLAFIGAFLPDAKGEIKTLSFSRER